MISTADILIRLGLACLFGALIGLERERKDWAAGLRTHMMVCVGSCLIMIVSAYGFSDIIKTDSVVLDPARVAAQVVSGIGFIGAGTILFLRRGIIRGLTTAAGLWTVAAIGLATGGGMFIAAGATTGIALIILWLLKPLERFFSRKYKYNTLRVVTHIDAESNEFLNMLLSDKSMDIKNFTLDRNDDGEFVYQMRFSTVNQENLAEIVNKIKKDPSIIEVLWTK